MYSVLSFCETIKSYGREKTSECICDPSSVGVNRLRAKFGYHIGSSLKPPATTACPSQIRYKINCPITPLSFSPLDRVAVSLVKEVKQTFVSVL